MTEAIAMVYAERRKRLKDLGRPVPHNDLWIAATCLTRGMPLATYDDHFNHVDDLVVLRP